MGVVRDATVNEASGCAASRTHPGILYTLNDHAGKNEIYVLATNGTLVATYDIKGSHNTDWEDLAIGPCGADSHSPADRHSPDCIYIGMTGVFFLFLTFEVVAPGEGRTRDLAIKSPTLSQLSYRCSPALVKRF